MLIGRLNTVLTKYYDLCIQVFQFHVTTLKPSVLNKFIIVKALVGVKFREVPLAALVTMLQHWCHCCSWRRVNIVPNGHIWLPRHQPHHWAGSYDHKGLFQQHKSWGESGIFGCNLMLHITLVTLQECHFVILLLQGWMQGTNILVFIPTGNR